MSNSNTPRRGTPKSGTPKSGTPKGRKENWLWNDDEFVLSTDNDCRIKPASKCIANLALVHEAGDELPDFAVSKELKDDIVFLSADTMGKANLCLGDFVHVSDGQSCDVQAAAIVWPKVQARLGTIIPSNNMKLLFKGEDKCLGQ